MNTPEKKIISLQTKVTRATAERMRACAELAGLKSPYELLQILVTKFLAIADREHEPVEEEIEEAESSKRWAEIFGEWLDYSKHINTAKPNREHDDSLVMAVIITRQPHTKVYSVKRIDFENEEPRFIDRNADKTINAVVRKLKPELYRDMIEIGRACDTKNVTEIITALLEDTTIPRIKDDGQSVLGFESVDYGGGYVRHNNKRGEHGSAL